MVLVKLLKASRQCSYLILDFSKIIHEQFSGIGISLEDIIEAKREIPEEYHNELYGFIEAEGQLDNYKSGQPTIRYIKILPRNQQTRDEQIILTEYIRHQIHHPENTHNQRYSTEQLKESICLMRDFINNCRNTNIIV